MNEVHSNNEKKYTCLALGIEWCVEKSIKRLNVFVDDAMLLNKQIQSTRFPRSDHFQGVIHFLEIGKCPDQLDKGQWRCLV